MGIFSECESNLGPDEVNPWRDPENDKDNYSMSISEWDIYDFIDKDGGDIIDLIAKRRGIKHFRVKVSENIGYVSIIDFGELHADSEDDYHSRRLFVNEVLLDICEKLSDGICKKFDVEDEQKEINSFVEDIVELYGLNKEIHTAKGDIHCEEPMMIAVRKNLWNDSFEKWYKDNSDKLDDY